MKYLLLAFICLAASVHQSEGLKCYVCSTQSVSSRSTVATRCPDPLDDSVVNDGCTSCGKISSTAGGVQNITRTCTPTLDCAKLEAAQSEGAEFTCNTCDDEDMCNSSTTLAVSTTLLLSVAFMLRLLNL